MKQTLFAAVLLIATLAGCKKGDEAKPTTQPSSPSTPTSSISPTSSTKVTNNGTPITVSMGVEEYGDVVDAGGTTVSRATITIYLPSPNGATAGVKYYVSDTNPLGPVKSVVSRPYNSSNYNPPASGTLTGLATTENGVKHLYLSGTFSTSLGPNYSTVVGSFTNLKAY